MAGVDGKMFHFTSLTKYDICILKWVKLDGVDPIGREKALLIILMLKVNVYMYVWLYRQK